MTLKAEQVLQINYVNWFNYEFPEFSEDLHHFANERYLIPKSDGSHWQAGRKLKRMNVKRGVLDLFLALPFDEFYGLWLELKIGKNKPTKEQLIFAERKIMRGYKVYFAWNLENSKEITLDYIRNFLSYRDKKLNNDNFKF